MNVSNKVVTERIAGEAFEVFVP